jgi:hypothetical protein
MSSDTSFGDFEHLIKRALTPVEPPADLSLRLESTLTELTELAQDELESWELSAMRDPRNWVRPVAAIAIGTAAGAGLIVLGWRRQHRQKRSLRAATVDPRRIVRR